MPVGHKCRTPTDQLRLRIDVNRTGFESTIFDVRCRQPKQVDDRRNL